jgi:hypothetical protein
LLIMLSFEVQLKEQDKYMTGLLISKHS